MRDPLENSFPYMETVINTARNSENIENLFKNSRIL
jgi:hypothetical protein